MTKTHFPRPDGQPVCWRTTGRISVDTNRVDCANCRKTPEFIDHKAASDAAKVAAFNAQEPRQFREPWHRDYGAVIVCKSCGGDTFRQGDRTCYGHYDNYVCASCGNTESRLTETGMSF